MKSYTKHIVLLLSLLFSFGQPVFSQSVTIKVDKDSIAVGEPIQMIISVKKKSQEEAVWPVFLKGDSLPAGFEILEVLPKQVSNNATDLVTQQLSITSFNPGKHFISPVVIQDSNGIITSNVLMINVGLLNADTAQAIRDIKPIKVPHITFGDRWWSFVQWLKANWYIALAILLVLVFVIWLFFFKKKKKETQSEVNVVKEPVIPAHIKALDSLANIRKDKAWETQDLKTYNDRLTNIIKEYLAQRYDIGTKQKTTTQIFTELKGESLPYEQRNNLRKLLTLSDLVKYAKQKPSEEENLEILNEAVDFVNVTKLQES